MSKSSGNYSYRYVAQIVLEATTALKTSSGKSDLFVDAQVLKDWNGLPMILGSSVAGVLRHSFEVVFQEEIFGYENQKENDGMGSRLLVSNAHLLDSNQKLHHALGRIGDDEFLAHYDNLPVREHVAINHQGVAIKGHKFDEEVVYAGSRFKFELELIGNEEDEHNWERILTQLASPLFRLGGGSTKGFGEMKVVSCLQSTYMMGKDYHEKPSDLNVSKGDNNIRQSEEKALCYKIAIRPADFFSFGSGFGDDEVDDIAVKEEVIVWNDEKGNFGDKQILMPASSLKGALAHRVAFHYNILEEVFADELVSDDFEKHTGSNNTAVREIFGAKKGHDHEVKGKALFSDVYQIDKDEVKIFDHVKIDRFTGGAMDSALYNEKVIAQKDIWHIKIILAENVDGTTKDAFEHTLDDLCKGWLPLGGKVNRGHGVFEGVDKSKGGYGEKGWMKEGGSDAER